MAGFGYLSLNWRNTKRKENNFKILTDLATGKRAQLSIRKIGMKQLLIVKGPFFDLVLFSWQAIYSLSTEFTLKHHKYQSPNIFMHSSPSKATQRDHRGNATRRNIFSIWDWGHRPSHQCSDEQSFAIHQAYAFAMFFIRAELIFLEPKLKFFWTEEFCKGLLQGPVSITFLQKNLHSVWV